MAGFFFPVFVSALVRCILDCEVWTLFERCGEGISPNIVTGKARKRSTNNTVVWFPHLVHAGDRERLLFLVAFCST